MYYNLLIKIFGPIILLVMVVFIYNNRINSAEQKGYNSRNIEVTALIDNIEVLKKDKIKINNQLVTVKENKDIFENEVNNLNSKLAAQSEQYKLELQLQAKAFASAQKSTNDAMNSLAKNVKSNDINFIEILEQLKGVTYEYDDKNDKCVVIGGGRVLRNAAKGKAG